MGDSKVYVGNLPDDVRENDIEDLFYKYGRMRHIDIKHGGGRGPPFAFLEFDDPRDAEDAVKYRDGYSLDGCTLRVEFARGGRGGFRGGFRDGRMGGGGGRGFGGGGGGGGGGGRYGPPSRRSDYRVRITGLPPSGSWQDLKDHMREAGDVCYADVYRDGTGVVEYLRHDDMKYALRKLDDTKFKSHEGETAYIRVKEDSGTSRSRSRSPVSREREGSRRRSPSYSPKRSRSRSGSAKSRDKSRSRSPY